MQSVTAIDDFPPDDQPTETPPEATVPKPSPSPPLIRNKPRRAAPVAPSHLHTDRLPPHSPQAEAAVVGAALVDSKLSVPESIRHGITTSAFYDLRHRAIWESALAIYKEKRDAVDVITVSEHLKGRHLLEEVGGITTLAALTDGVISPANVGYWADIVVEKWILRESVKLFTEAVGRIYDDDSDIRDLVSDTGRIVEHLQNSAIRLAGQSGGGIDLTMRSPSQILGMTFDDGDCILGDRLLSVGQSLVIAGQGGIGKSRLAGLQLPISCITGQRFIDIETHNPNLRWLLLQVENSNRRLRDDLLRFQKWCNGTWDRVDQQLIVHTLENDGDSFVSLENPDNFLRVVRAIEDSKADVVIFDSLYNFTTEDLNSDVGMALALSNISRVARRGDHKRSIVVLHHAATGKYGAARVMGYDRSSFGRNSKVLFNWCRAQINVAPGSADSNDSLVVACGKNNNGKEFPTFAVKLTSEMVYVKDEEFDLKSWMEELTGKKRPTMTVEMVAAMCEGAMKKVALKEKIMEATGLKASAADEWVNRALKAKELEFLAASNLYMAVKKSGRPKSQPEQQEPPE